VKGSEERQKSDGSMPVDAGSQVDDDPLGVAGGHGVDGGLHGLELLVRADDQRALRLDLFSEEGPVDDVVALLGQLRLGVRAAGQRRERGHRRGDGQQDGEEAWPGHRCARVRVCKVWVPGFLKQCRGGAGTLNAAFYFWPLAAGVKGKAGREMRGCALFH
jgi:hypothetical protein